MVHALTKVRPWLCSDGCILVIHDLIDPPRVEVHKKDHQLFAGQMLSDNSFENQLKADQAIDTVIQEGSYLLGQSRIFENYIRADSYDSMFIYVAESWESAYITDGTRQKVHELVDMLGKDSQVVLHLVSRMVKLEIP
jgi:hypothetical protein